MSDVSGQRSPAFWDSPAYQALILENTRLRWQVPAYRSILTDLIAELQDASTGYDPDCQNGCGDVPGAGCPAHYEEAVERAADRAEQRLREVQGDGVEPNA